MRKILVTLFGISLLTVVSCSSVDSKIEKINDLVKESKELVEEGNMTKAMKNSMEINKLYLELLKEDLSPEQQRKLNKAINGKL